MALGLLIRGLLPKERKTGNGYIESRSTFGKFRLDHRRVAERILGRKLMDNEVVHHINGRRSDNRPENLCVMDEEDHLEYHEWYDWIHSTYNVYPRGDTQRRKLREHFGGILLAEVSTL
jgi:hypothetical protein